MKNNKEIARSKMLSGIITEKEYKKIINKTNLSESQTNDLPVEQIVDLLNSGSENIKEVWTPSHENSFVVMFTNGHQQDVSYTDYFEVVCNRSGINHTHHL